MAGSGRADAGKRQGKGKEMNWSGKNSKYALFALIALLLLLKGVPGAYSQEAQSDENPQVKLLKEVEVLLPENSPIKINWILPPVDKTILENHLHERWFSVDADGFPWIGLDGRLLINPVKNYSATLSEFYASFTHLRNGALIVATDEDFGFIAAEKETEYDPDTGYPILSYQPIAWLPGIIDQPGEEIVSRTMFRGDNCLYFLVTKTLPGEEYQEKNEVFCFRPAPAQGTSGTDFALPPFDHIYTSNEKITAVSGDGEKTFVAHGQTVILITPESNEPIIFYKHPTNEVVALDYTKEAGLFYATSEAVGVMSEGAALEFMKVPSPKIFLQGNSLYVMLSEKAAVIRVENADFLQRYNKTSRELIAVNGTKISSGSIRINFFLVIVVSFILLLIVLIDILKNQFPGQAKIVWVMMVFIGYLALVLWLATLFFELVFGFYIRRSSILIFVPFLIVLVYWLLGRRERIRS